MRSCEQHGLKKEMNSVLSGSVQRPHHFSQSVTKWKPMITSFMDILCVALEAVMFPSSTYSDSARLSQCSAKHKRGIVYTADSMGEKGDP